LRAQLDKLTGSSENTTQLVKEIYTQYPDIDLFSVSEIEFYDTKTMEHHPMPVIYLQWKDGKRHPEAEKRLLAWLKVRLKVEEIEIMRQ